ncbi:MAG: hypothetical protein QM775_09510 [Pirellulales bacterium]
MKLDDVTIGEKELIGFLDTQSDFEFELSILRLLSERRFTCDHGGTYADEATKKPRQFDIRASRTVTDGKFRYTVRLAVECKNIGRNFPLLVSRVPRRHEEAFNEVIVSADSDVLRLPRFTPLKNSESIRLQRSRSLYNLDRPVGKACDQVGLSRGEVCSSDTGIYDKWSQALSSAHDLTSDAFSAGYKHKCIALSLVLPILIVPDGRLWVADHDAEGKRKGSPYEADRCSYYVNREYNHGTGGFTETTTVSHLEFCTAKGLLELLQPFTDDVSFLEMFEEEHLMDKLGYDE